MQADATGGMTMVPVNPGDVFEINNVVPHEASHQFSCKLRKHMLC